MSCSWSPTECISKLLRLISLSIRQGDVAPGGFAVLVELAGVPVLVNQVMERLDAEPVG